MKPWNYLHTYPPPYSLISRPSPKLSLSHKSLPPLSFSLLTSLPPPLPLATCYLLPSILGVSHFPLSFSLFSGSFYRRFRILMLLLTMLSLRFVYVFYCQWVWLIWSSHPEMIGRKIEKRYREYFQREKREKISVFSRSSSERQLGF